MLPLPAILQRYGIQHSAPPQLASGGFSGAAVWKVNSRLGVFALRRWPDEGLPDQRILGLHSLLAHISRNGADQIAGNVAVPVPNDQGSTLTRTGSQRWQLEPWLHGTADFDADPNDARLNAAMESLAAWHIAARSFEPDRSAAEWFSSGIGPCSSVSRRLALFRYWDGQLVSLQPIVARDESEFGLLAIRVVAFASSLLPRVQSELASFVDQAIPLQPCLRDVWHDHVLFEQDTVSGIIDPSAARTANIATDLARLLGSLLRDDFIRWSVAIEAYAAVRSLSLVEHQLIFALDRAAVVLSPLTWLRRRYVEHAAIQTDDVLPRLRSQLKRLERLAGSNIRDF